MKALLLSYLKQSDWSSAPYIEGMRTALDIFR